MALTFSSTIIIVKLLTDKREIDSLHGRIAIGFLIVQDIVVVLVMIGLSALGEPGGQPLGWRLLWVLLKGAAFLGAVALMMRWVLPALLQRLARSQELLVLFAVSWAMILATLGDLLGFSKEVGAFLAGMSLASMPLGGLEFPPGGLRDFLLVFDFIDLGSRLNLAILGAQLGKALLFSLFVLVGNPLIVMIIMGYHGVQRALVFWPDLPWPRSASSRRSWAPWD